ncbi:MAG: response regulator [Pseudomonadota bacterium]
MHVLLADDDKATRDLAARALETQGHTVTVCEDGTAAAGALQALGQSVDLIITDVEMPGMGGAEFGAKALEAHPAVRILLISGFEAELEKARSALSAFSASAKQPVTLMKPFTLAQLRTAVEDAQS